MILGGILAGTGVLVFLISCSYFDIKNRKLPTALMITNIFMFCCGIAFTILTILTETTYLPYLVNLILCVALYICITLLNGLRMRENKDILIGGADTSVLLVLCIISPFCFGMVPSVLMLFGGAFVLATFAGFIQKIQEYHLKRGVPFIVYIAATWVCTQFIPCLMGL